jgi:phosphatidylserine/phosphatidylglycerophosphate/cardiolipin synthase-like enzyme
MKVKVFISFIILFATVSLFAQESILSARTKLGQAITVKGLVTNGSELGAIRYLQDETGGMAAYSSSLLKNVNKGDSIIVSGTLKNYNNLLEIDPVSSVQVISSGHQQPTAVVVTPKQIGERYESQLIKIKKVSFTNAGATFEGNKNYNFTSNGETGVIRINNASTAIIGQMVPSGEVDLVAICSQFSYNTNDTTTGYQLLVRSMDDFIVESAILFTSPLMLSNLGKNGFKLKWTTNINGTTEAFYGLKENQLGNKVIGTVTASGNEFLHEVTLTGIEPASMVYVNAFSVTGTDTAFSSVKVFATQSNSSGNIKVYFNTPVDHSVSKGANAVYLNKAIDDTLIAYINRVKESIDFTIYNFNNSNISNISAALNNAHKRGVKVRIISCGTAKNLGVNDLDSDVPRLESPEFRDGIMHNKFVVFDAHSSDPNVPLVWTGATNFTDGQINKDPNNVIIIQDQSLAKAYELEFNEMWGSETTMPNATKAMYGAFKKDNTPHEFIIGGKRVECYFSPSDGTNQKIIDALKTANNDLSIATMLLTRSDIAYAIRDAKNAGVVVNVLTNDKGGNTDLVNDILTSALGTQHYVFDDYVEGIMHHKYAVIDQNKLDSDPMVITGSHNWSASANDRNDENTLIIHDATLANIYYQQFVWNFLANYGSFDDITQGPVAVNDTVSLSINGSAMIEVMNNDQIGSAVVLSIEQSGKHGNTYIPFTNFNVIAYDANNGFVGTDTIVYRITYVSDAKYTTTGKIIVNVGLNSKLDITSEKKPDVFPNPFVNELRILNLIPLNSVFVYDLSGKTVYKRDEINASALQIDLSHLAIGSYMLKVVDQKSIPSYQKIVKR